MDIFLYIDIIGVITVCLPHTFGTPDVLNGVGGFLETTNNALQAAGGLTRVQSLTNAASSLTGGLTDVGAGLTDFQTGNIGSRGSSGLTRTDVTRGVDQGLNRVDNGLSRGTTSTRTNLSGRINQEFGLESPFGTQQTINRTAQGLKTNAERAVNDLNGGRINQGFGQGTQQGLSRGTQDLNSGFSNIDSRFNQGLTSGTQDLNQGLNRGISTGTQRVNQGLTRGTQDLEKDFNRGTQRVNQGFGRETQQGLNRVTSTGIDATNRINQGLTRESGLTRSNNNALNKGIDTRTRINEVQSRGDLGRGVVQTRTNFGQTNQATNRLSNQNQYPNQFQGQTNQASNRISNQNPNRNQGQAGNSYNYGQTYGTGTRTGAGTNQANYRGNQGNFMNRGADRATPVPRMLLQGYSYSGNEYMYTPNPLMARGFNQASPYQPAFYGQPRTGAGVNQGLTLVHPRPTGNTNQAATYRQSLGSSNTYPRINEYGTRAQTGVNQGLTLVHPRANINTGQTRDNLNRNSYSSYNPRQTSRGNIASSSSLTASSRPSFGTSQANLNRNNYVRTATNLRTYQPNESTQTRTQTGASFNQNAVRPQIGSTNYNSNSYPYSSGFAQPNSLNMGLNRGTAIHSQVQQRSQAREVNSVNSRPQGFGRCGSSDFTMVEGKGNLFPAANGYSGTFQWIIPGEYQLWVLDRNPLTKDCNPTLLTSSGELKQLMKFTARTPKSTPQTITVTSLPNADAIRNGGKFGMLLHWPLNAPNTNYKDDMNMDIAGCITIPFPCA